MDFNVIQLSALVFHFSVSCREVGFLINHLQSYKCESFIVYFHLWNNGGANWKKKLAEYEKEEKNSWQMVSHKKIIYADAMRKPPLTGANSTPVMNRK